MFRRLLVATAAVAFAGSAAAGQAPAAPMDSLAFARKLSEWFFTAQKDSLWAHSSADIQKMMQKPDAFVDALNELSGRAGAEQKVIEEKFVKRKGNTQYWRTSKYSIEADPVMIRFAFSPDFKIIGIGMNKASEAPEIDPIK
jgi:hypothetical protein